MRGARVSCEVTPHHLWFDDSRLTYRVNPPIRKADDVTALIDAIKDGTVTCIGTDHAPHTAEEKEKGAAGMVGLETAFGVCYTKLTGVLCVKGCYSSIWNVTFPPLIVVTTFPYSSAPS